VAAVQLDNAFAPLITGNAPVPYDPKVIWFPELPDVGTVSVSRQVQLFWNSTESPALKLPALTFATVSHGVEVEVPLFESEPTVTQLST
jgi:hypothetical protein